MSYDAERSELEAVIEASGPVGVPVSYDAQRFDAVAPSIEMTILSGNAFQASYGAPGSNLVRYVGIVVFKIRTVGGAGSITARGYAETIKTAYINNTLATVKCGIPYLQNTLQEAPFYSLNVIVPFTRDAFEA